MDCRDQHNVEYDMRNQLNVHDEWDDSNLEWLNLPTLGTEKEQVAQVIVVSVLQFHAKTNETDRTLLR